MSEYMALVTRKVTTIQHQIVMLKSGAPQYVMSDAVKQVRDDDWVDTKKIVSLSNVDHVKELA